ncbi:hypothetical protein [Vibrio sp. Hal054]|uniref:hypothetical protein n=1 Tax=Vibrio sp. Hal054 TaxID=3035158 RepID=UPI00301C3D74
MAVFIINSLESYNSMLQSAIEDAYDDDDWIAIGVDTWLVDDNAALVPRSVTERLLADYDDQSNPFGSYIVVAFNSYWGYHEKETWEWLKRRGF